MAFGGVHPFMLKKAAAAPEATGVIWDVDKWRCHKGKPSWDLDATRFLGVSLEVNHTITDGYGEGTHYAEFLVSSNDSITGAGVVSPDWFTGYCSSDSAGATPTSSLNSYMDNVGFGTWKTSGYINADGGNISIAGTSVSDRIGIEVDVQNNTVRFYKVVDSGTNGTGTRTELGEVDYMNDGVDFDPNGTGTPKASFAASSYTLNKTIQIYSNSADWWGTPTSGYVAMTSD